MLALHKFRDSEKQFVFLLSDGVEVKQYDEASFAKVVKKLKPNTKIVSTSSNPTDAILSMLSTDIKADIYSAHWHSTGISKNLPPEEIAIQFARLAESQLRKFSIRTDIQQLKLLVNMRHALVEYRKSAQLRLSAVERAGAKGVTAELKEISDAIKSDAKEFESPIDKEIIRVAQSIVECQVLQELMGTKTGWLSAAQIVAEIQDLRRFPMVSSLWHYAGLHGDKAKRKKGIACDWNPKLKVALYKWASACMKAMVPSFRQPYEAYRAEERLIHESKCKCKTPDGHSTMRAFRRVEKDLLKNFFVKMRTIYETA